MVIIVNWNTGQLLANCLESLARLPEKDLIREVIVVDNASSDRSMAFAKQVVSKTGNRPRVRFIQNEENLGFAQANNIGLDRVVVGGPADSHVLLLNPDTAVKAGAILGLQKVLDGNEKIGIVGPKLINADGSLQPSVRRFPNGKVMALLLLKLNKIWPNNDTWKQYMARDFNYTKEQEVDQVMGAAFLIKDEVISDIGKLDEDFWIWFEEVDYCRRAKSQGWQVVYTPQAEVLHYGGVSFNQLVSFKKSLPWIRSMLKYSTKHLPKSTNIFLRMLLPLAIVVVLPASIKHLLIRKGSRGEV